MEMCGGLVYTVGEDIKGLLWHLPIGLPSFLSSRH
jgi:hypothetical protein